MRTAVFLAFGFFAVFASAVRDEVGVYDDFTNGPQTVTVAWNDDSSTESNDYMNFGFCNGMLTCGRGVRVRVSSGTPDAGGYRLDVSNGKVLIATPLSPTDQGFSLVYYFSQTDPLDVTFGGSATGMRITYTNDGSEDLLVTILFQSGDCQEIHELQLAPGDGEADVDFRSQCDLQRTNSFGIIAQLGSVSISRFSAIDGDSDDACPPGTFKNVDDVCRSCGGGCAECASADTCATCESENFFKNADNVCRRCPAGCRSCTSEAVCEPDGCRPGFGLKADQSCAACPAGCSACIENSGTFDCIMCDTGRFLTVEDKLCKLSCPAGQYESFGGYRLVSDDGGDRRLSDDGGGRCETCPDGCEICTQRTGIMEGDWTSVSDDSPRQAELDREFSDAPVCYACQKKSDGTNTFSQDGECGTECLGATYKDVDSFMCLACPHACTKCSSRDECSECAANFVLSSDSKRCIQSCPSGETENSDGKCVACAGDCATCTGVLETDCLSCKPASGKYYNPEANTCVDALDCPSDRYAKETGATNEEFRICHACSPRCTTGCTGPSRSDCAREMEMEE